MTELPPYPGAPRWAKVLGIILIVVVLLFLILMFTHGPGGRHGPGRHLRSDDTGGQAAPPSVTGDRTPGGGPGGQTAPEGGHG